MVFELIKTFPNAMEIAGCEPSPEMSELSRNIILQNKKIDSIPVFSPIKDSITPAGIDAELFQQQTKLNSALKPQLVTCTLEQTPFRREYFDLITCLNVVDRHPHPIKLVELLFEFLLPGGMLCLASPLDWEESSTDKNEWVDSLHELLPVNAQVLQEISIPYSFRSYAREVVTYSSQVILVKKLPKL
jgi:SAM-dependent methyltransferase